MCQCRCSCVRERREPVLVIQAVNPETLFDLQAVLLMEQNQVVKCMNILIL